MSLVIERSRFYAAALHKSVLLVAGTLCYVSISLLWLPYGLNLQSLKILSLLLWPALAVLFVFLKLNKFEHHQLVVKANAYDVSNVILVLLPMTPILRYILANQDILSSHQSVGVFCLFLLASLIYAYFLPILLSLALAHIDEFTILGLSFTFSLFFSPYLSSCNYFYQTLLIPLCVGLTSFIGFGAYLFDKKFLPLILCAILLLALSFFLIELPYFNSSYYSTKLLLMPFSLFVAFFISYGLYAFNPKLIKIMVTVLFLTSLFNAESFNQSLNAAVQTERMNSKIQTLAKSRQMIAKPDIFLLTYESYVCNETMLKYGIDNSDQESYLIQKGFTIYPGVYTIGPGSTISMNAVFDVSSDEKTAQGATSGNGNVQRLLQYHGYETFGIFSNNYFFWGQSFDYDHCFPSANISEKLGAPIILLASILQGEFGCFAGFNGFAYSIYLSEKQDTLALPRKAKPRFVYTHNRYPGHSQYSGLIIVGDEIDIYRAGLQKANAEMKSDVETLIKSNPESIIIINGDHGPRLLQNVEHINKIGRVNIQDRYGSFLAIKWPENIHVQYNKISVLQDTFPVILAVLFNTTEFINTKVAPKTLQPETVAGAFVDNGIIIGGKDDGKPLYELSNLFSEP